MSEPKPLGEHVRPKLTEARLARQWDAISSRVRPRRRIPLWPLAVLTLVATAATALFLMVELSDPSESAAWDGAVVESGNAPTLLRLKEGSQIELGPDSRLALTEDRPDVTIVELKRGRAHFNVESVAGRTFYVRAASVEVKVVGTRFTVEHADGEAGARVSVAVDEGRVEAVAPEGRVSLSSGQRWSAPVGIPAPSTVKAKEAPREDLAAKPPEPERDTQDRDILDPTAARTARPAPPVESAKELFERANAARQAGDTAGATQAYQALLTQFPSDQRAGLSAFELGRLQMDRYGNAASAARSLNRALAAGNSPFREDAMARLVHAYDTMGAKTECRRAQQNYLEQYRNGVHRAAVASRCGARP